MLWFERSLHRKLSFILVAATMIPIILLGCVAYYTSSTITEEKAKLTGINTLHQVNAIMETMVQDVENMSVFLIGQQEVQQYLTRSKTTALEYTRMVGFLTNLGFSKPYISDIRIVPLNGNPELSNITVSQTDLYQYVNMSPAYWADLPKWWSPPLYSVNSSGFKQSVSLVRPIRDLNKFQMIGMLSIGIDTAVLADKLSNAVMEDGVMFLVNREGQLVAGSQLEIEADYIAAAVEAIVNPSLNEDDTTNETSDSMKNFRFNSESHVVISTDMALLPWRAYLVIPNKTFSAQNRYVLQLTAIAVVIALLLTAIVVWFFVRQVTKPLIRLTRHLPGVDPERAYRPLPVESLDEVGLLIASYNQMNDNIRQLTEKVKTNEAMKKEADLQALQAQIQPHFLYNTLSSVQWMAWMSRNDDIANMVGALGDFLRFSLNRGLEGCTIEQELEHIHNYLLIQAIRYPDRFTTEVIVPPDLLGQRMLKLLLQPVVENALLHGILKDKRGRQGLLTIEGNWIDERYIELIVRDNGLGMSEDQLKQLHARLNRYHEESAIRMNKEDISANSSTQGGYGLFNVQQRLLLHYGEHCKLQVDSQLGEGTSVRLTIAVKWEERGHLVS